MSPAYLSVYIKEKTGANFSDHLNEIRIRKAKELLIVTEMSIQDISLEVGYANITSFNRMFKKQIGMSPGEYRKQQISQIHKVK
jgi:YesN/AraC family two-component response regulator